jgi:hypothetical protein
MLPNPQALTKSAWPLIMGGGLIVAPTAYHHDISGITSRFATLVSFSVMTPASS